MNGLLESLESELVTKIRSEVSDIIENKNPTGKNLPPPPSPRPPPPSLPAAMLKEFKAEVRGCLKHVQMAASVSPGKKLGRAVEALLHTANTFTQGMYLPHSRPNSFPHCVCVCVCVCVCLCVQRFY